MIREIRVEDAAAFLQLGKQLDEETTFMLLEPGERNTTVEQQDTNDSTFCRRSIILLYL